MYPIPSVYGDDKDKRLIMPSQWVNKEEHHAKVVEAFAQ